MDAVPEPVAGERPAVMVMEGEFSLLRGAPGCTARAGRSMRRAQPWDLLHPDLPHDEGLSKW